MREIAPQHEEHWFEIYGRIALTGEPMRFENEARQLGRWYDVYAFRVEDPKLGRVGILFNDITERKRAEEERREHLWFLESMDRINRAMQHTNDLEAMTSGVLEEALTIFHCDRARVVYPADPNVATYRAVMEQTRPEYPSAIPVGKARSVDPEMAEICRRALDAPGAVADAPVPAVLRELSGTQALLVAAIRPKGDRPYLFVLHQCSQPRAWSASECRLFEEIARRLEDALTSVLAHRNLLASEERYARAMEGSDAGHWDWNIVTDEMFLSERAREMLALAPGELPARRGEIMERVPMHPDDRAAMSKVVRASVQSGIHERDYRVMPRPGEVRWLHSRAKVYKDARGAAVRMTGSLADITERKLAAERLRESEERFRDLTEISSDFYWETDAEHRYTSIEFGKAYVGMRDLGLKLGRTRWEIASRIPSPTPDEAGWAAHRAVCDAREPIVDFGFSRVENGVERFYEISGEPRFDARGGFLGYRGVGRDVTDRKHAEEARRLSEERYSLALQASEEGHFDHDIDTDELFISERMNEIFGFPPRTRFESRDAWMKRVRFYGDDGETYRAAVRAAVANGGPDRYEFEYRILRPSGEMRWLRTRAKVTRNAEGRAIRRTGVVADITERRRAEEERSRLERQLRLAQRLEAMGTLAGGIAHDFNNILGAILGFGEMALRGAAKGSRLQRDLESIMTAGERGRALVDRVLAFSRSGVGERAAVHVEKEVREALELIAGKLPANVRIETELRAGQAAMLGDPTQIHQVLMNLATNAVQAMPAGGTLRVQLATRKLEAPQLATVGTIPAGELIVLKVGDTGTGIPPEVIGRIFDPFFTTKEVGVGTGLGLSLVHGLVTEAGGGVDVASVPGEGSTFTVYLPRAGDAADAGESAPPDMPRGHRECVLVVDDEEPLVSLATRTLEELGYAPVGFTSSAAALEAFRLDPQRFDAVITDERMPGVSGTALIREVRGVRGAIPVLLMSGYVGGGVASQAREAGANAVLKKPLLARELATSLARVFQRH
jgi:PAS domain S-box-containing protein